MKVTTNQIIAIVIIGLIIQFGYPGGIPGLVGKAIQGYTPSTPSTGSSTSSATVTVTQPVVPVGSLNMLFGVYDAISGAGLTTSATNVETIPYNNLGTQQESKAMASTATVSSAYYAPGSDWYLHAYSTLTNKYYDGWFHAHLPDVNGNGGTLTQLIVSAPACPSTTVTITETQVGAIIKAGAGGTTQYWQLPPMNLYYEETAANTNANILDPTGKSMNQRATNALNNAGGENAAGTVTAFKNTGASNYTAAAKQSNFNFLVSLADTKVAYGASMITVSSNSPYVLQARFPTVWVAVNSTALNNGYTTAAGWCLTSVQVPGYTTFYKFIPPVLSTQTTTGFASISIPIDTTPVASSTVLGVAIYMGDMQLPVDVAQGSSDGAPTAYGGVAAVGPSAVIGKTYSSTATAPGACLVHFRFTTF